MWRLGLVLCASCTLMPVQASGGAGVESPQQRTVEAGPRPTADPIVMPISNRPADPWAGVKGDQPATFDDELEFNKRWEVRTQQVACTAARDHCLPSIAWMWIHEGDRTPVRSAHVIAFTPAGPSSPHYAKAAINSDPFTAYRTVPATRANLVEGALVAVHASPIPEDPVAAFGLWSFGAVERVDWDLGFVYLVGSKEPRFITASRVAVMSFTPGGRVTILGDRARDQLAVSPADVILPDP